MFIKEMMCWDQKLLFLKKLLLLTSFNIFWLWIVEANDTINLEEKMLDGLENIFFFSSSLLGYSSALFAG